MTVIAVDPTSFDATVVEGSRQRPVLVDFWAPWCAPCRALAPVLDKVAADYADRVTFVKLDTDEDQAIAARYGVRGIPNCKLFVDGEVVDEFSGTLPERALREWLDAALPSPAAARVAAAAQRLAQGDAAGALPLLDEAAEIDAADESLLLTRAEALLALGRGDEAGDALAALEDPQRARSRPVRDERRLAALKARAALAAPAAADIGALARAAAASPPDCAAKLDYARALAAGGDYERALAELLAIVRADRRFGDDAGRRTMLTIFEVLGSDSDLVRRYRRELASVINR